MLTIPKPTHSQLAWSIYFIWLHEVGIEMSKKAHPSWKGYTKSMIEKVEENLEKMTEAEQQEFFRKATLYPLRFKKRT